MKKIVKHVMFLAFFVLMVFRQNVPVCADAASAYQLYVVPQRTVLLGNDKTDVTIFLKNSQKMVSPERANAAVKLIVENPDLGVFAEEEVELLYDNEKEGWFGKREFSSGIQKQFLKASLKARICSATNFTDGILGLESNQANITFVSDLNVSQNYIKLNTHFLTLSPANNYTGQIGLLIENAVTGITWTSSNPSAVLVDANGVVRAVGNGVSLITASSPQTEFQSFCLVSTAGFEANVTGISMDGEAALSQYMTMDFASKVKVWPENASNKNFYLESSNPEVAYFVGTELIPKANGITTVKATTYDGGYTAECKVTVTGISGTGEKQKIQVSSVVKTYGSKPFQLKVKTSDDCELEYSSSNKKVAAISKAGKVTVKGYGKTTITIKAKETDLYQAAEKRITVKVVPKRAVIKKLYSNGKKKIFCSWKKDSTVTAYQIAVSEKKKFTKGISENFLKKSFGLSGLKSGKTYYVRIRAYKKVNGKKYYGAWSKIKAVKVK